MISKAKIKKLKRDLKGRSVKPVAEKLGISEVAVFATLRGASYNERTIIALIEYRDELELKAKEIESRI